MRKKLVVFFMLITLLLTTVVGCKATTGGGTKVTLNEVAHSVFYSPMYVAIENGYF